LMCGLVSILVSVSPSTQPDRTLPTGARLDATYFDSETHGFVRACCGTPNKVLETFNGGRSWERTEKPVPGLRRGRAYIDQTSGWSVVEDAWPHSSIYQTSDGGTTWKCVLQAHSKGNFYFDGIQATSASDVWALGINSYHSSDGGKNWQLINIGYTSLDFLDSAHGWALGGGLWRTIDGGKTWREFTIPKSLFPADLNYLLTDVYFVDTKRGWIVGGGSEENSPEGKEEAIILTTNDGGENWKMLARIGNSYLWSIFFLNEKVGWVAGLDGSFLKTEDGGKTWVDPI
jgi:photosystem II stability/assembly factor-like uncharacterized protein